MTYLTNGKTEGVYLSSFVRTVARIEAIRSIVERGDNELLGLLDRDCSGQSTKATAFAKNPLQGLAAYRDKRGVLTCDGRFKACCTG